MLGPSHAVAAMLASPGRLWLHLQQYVRSFPCEGGNKAASIVTMAAYRCPLSLLVAAIHRCSIQAEGNLQKYSHTFYHALNVMKVTKIMKSSSCCLRRSLLSHGTLGLSEIFSKVTGSIRSGAAIFEYSNYYKIWRPWTLGTLLTLAIASSLWVWPLPSQSLSSIFLLPYCSFPLFGPSEIIKGGEDYAALLVHDLYLSLATFSIFQSSFLGSHILTCQKNMVWFFC
jgi:hypothetical protein